MAVSLNGNAAREISYADFADTPAARAMVRALEHAFGRGALLRMADGYERELAEGGAFFGVMQNRFQLTLTVDESDLARIPSSGPLIVVANHPFGIADGLAMGRLLEMARGPGAFRILAHKVFHRARELSEIILPIRFDGSREAQAENIETRRKALAHLAEGGCVGVFPGGTVSTSLRPFGPPLDPTWRGFTAQMIRRSGATVLPVYFEGGNSRVFQLVSRMSYSLRLAFLLHEFRTTVGGVIRLRVGAPIPAEEIDARRGDSKALMSYLREATYALAPSPLPGAPLGLDLG